MIVLNSLAFKDRKGWRGWPEENHDRKKEVWVLLYKKHTSQPLPHIDTLNEALCFGWIDGKLESIDVSVI